MLRSAPWTSPAAMDALRLERLRATVALASRSSPYYRQALARASVDLRSLADLAQLPVSSKVDVRASGLDRARPRRSVGVETWRTSGSSGEPYTFSVDRLFGERHDAQRAYVYLRAGVPERAPIVEILGRTENMSPRPWYPTFARTIVGFLGGDITEHVRVAAPTLLYGNRSHLLQVADELPAGALSIPFVCSSSETLQPQDEAVLSAALGAAVFEVYGSAEASNLAFRLPGEDSWTVLEPRVIVEVLDAEREPVAAGEIGEIVVTTLTEPTSPLIRYATGDLARVASGDAAGGSGLRLAALQGRATDSLVASDGTRVPFWSVATPRFWANEPLTPHVRRWQVHQSSDHSVAVSVELAGAESRAVVEGPIREHLQTLLGPVSVELRPCDQVHDPSRGKFRAVTCDVPT